jgi:hypothetical protein
MGLTARRPLRTRTYRERARRPGVAVPLPGVAVPLPGVAVPLPGVAVPLPGVAVPLAGEHGGGCGLGDAAGTALLLVETDT